MVIMMRKFTCAVAFAGSILTGQHALAEDLTSQDLQLLFKRQVEAKELPLTRSLTGQSNRSLSMITVDNVVAEPVVVGTEISGGLQPLSTQTDTTVPNTDTTIAASDSTQPLVAARTEPLVYAQLVPELQVNLQIKFDFDSAALASDQKAKLDTLCDAMKSSDIGLFRIIGHTDTSGADDYNERLSVLRAKEVARHLVQDCGIAAARLETVGLGERFPVNTADTKADENRRVEFQALS